MARLPNRFPISQLLPTQGLLESVFEDFFSPSAEGVTQSRWVPHLDVSEDEAAYSLSIERPGMKPEDVRVTFEDGVLTISGEKSQEEVKDTETMHRVERRYGSFKRSMTFPLNVDGESISANTEHGVLTVRLPKAAESKPRRIEVQSSE
jgi:HSP20 family protein